MKLMKKLSDCKKCLEGTVIITPFLANLCTFVNVFCEIFKEGSTERTISGESFI